MKKYLKSILIAATLLLSVNFAHAGSTESGPGPALKVDYWYYNETAMNMLEFFDQFFWYLEFNMLE